jgi:PTH1 family peptidyl-tRNA hydrolase
VRFWRRQETVDTAELRLIVGLGNPGGRYARTRHNIGYMVLERMADRYHWRFSGSKHRAEVARGTLDYLPLMLALPTTYMNESGNAVLRLVRYYHVPLEHLLVVCDDLDLPFGTLRLRASGSSGGNRGLTSIIRALGSNGFARLRVGVGRPHSNAVAHVLGEFTADQTRVLPALLDTAVDAVILAARDGIPPAMNRFNRDWLPELDTVR